jgi:hypothetical protein
MKENTETVVVAVDEWATQSRTIGKLAEALAKVQKDVEKAHKSAENPFFKSKYADLAACWDACREPLAKNDFAVIQTMQGEALRTVLAHKSGEWIAGTTPLLMNKRDMQQLGSAVTYARRYGLCAIVGISPADDDGNAAVGKKPKADKPKWHGPKTRTDLTKDLRDLGNDMKACEDYDSLVALLNQEATINILTQCEKDFPEWWHGQTEPEVVVGLKDKIDAAKKRLEGLDAPPMDA